MKFTPMRVALPAIVFAVTIAAIALWTRGGSPREAEIGEAGIRADVTPGITLGGAAARRFDANDLAAGDLFPAVEIFESDGSAFNTSSLKGRYTVLVNGCLT